MTSTDLSPYLSMTPDELRKLQWKRGWPLSLIGAIVYGFLRLFGQKPMDYKGICQYFIIGSNWGGVCFGWFFICCKNCGDYTKHHEVGHSVQAAAIGGFRMLCLSLCSAARYWWRCFFGANTTYDSWWFESQATDLGTKYVQHIENTRSKRTYGNH